MRWRSSLGNLPVLGALLAASVAACTPAAAPHPKAPATAAPSASGSSAPAPASSAAPPPALSAPPLPPPPPNAASDKVTRKSDPAWAACRRAFEPKKKDVAADVAALGQGCAKATQLKPLGKRLTGAQSDQDPPQSFPFQAQAGHCYRVYAQGSDGIRDLDVAIKDSTGALAGEDATDSPTAVLFEDGAICFNVADAAVIVVSVGLGKGSYAAEVWSDAP